jgi:hypothetical protein
MAGKLLPGAAGDEPASAGLVAGQVAAANLVIQQVAGESGQAGGLARGTGQPPGGRVRRAGRVKAVELARCDAARNHGLRMTNLPIKIRNKAWFKAAV